MVDPDTYPDENRGLFQTPLTADGNPLFSGSTMVHPHKLLQL